MHRKRLFNCRIASILQFSLLSLFLMLASMTTSILQAQGVSGTVTDSRSGETIIGCTILVVDTSIGAVTDFDGNYTLNLEPGTYTLRASYIGYTSEDRQITISGKETTTADFGLTEGVALDEFILLGTRAPNRTNTDSPVPIDVINVGQLAVSAPQTSINQILHYTAPSFSSNTQTISDGTDHIDPASLRGLGPDQVLVLVNGKRRHTTSLVNTNGTFGRGSVGTDLNAIPASAIEAIEVLRDGAAAQYGSDAIAGVINLRLKNSVNKLGVNFTTGGNFTDGIGAFEGETKNIDGEVFNLGVNYGLPLTENGGYINMTGEFNQRGSTNRMLEFDGGIFNAYNAIERVATADGADISNLSLDQIQNYATSVSHFTPETAQSIAGATDLTDITDALRGDATDGELAARGLTRSDFNMRVGQSRLRGGQFFANMGLPLVNGFEFYAFGGIGYRNGESGCFYRLPSQNRTTTAIYPNGTVPKINSNIGDKSVGAGIRGKVGNWDIDLSNVFGSNTFNFFMSDTHNATLGVSSPTTFDAGGHSFAQNTGNLDISQYFDLGSMPGVNVAFGAEYRFENFKVIPGTELSYGNYDVNGNLINPATPDDFYVTDGTGRGRPSGAQCFAGFLPTNDVDANRSSAAAYADVEFDITKAFLVSGALRFENYSDFGSTLNYKAAARYKISDNLNLRASFSTGFRAPSLHQINYSRTSTIFELVNGVSVPQEVGVFANTSRAAQLLGIPKLKEETSQNYSVGLTAKLPSAGLKITIDAYRVNIDDRVILTGRFSAPSDSSELASILTNAGANSAAFFSNAIDTKSEGIDFVIAHSIGLGSNLVLRNDLAGTLSRTTWDRDITSSDLDDDDPRVVVDGIKVSQLLADEGLVGTYFDQTSRIYLEQAVPRVKVTLSNGLEVGKFKVYLRNTYFGETTEASNEAIFDDDLNLLPAAELEGKEAVDDPYNSPKIITDLSLGYNVTNNLSLTIGANNLLDVYPDLVDDGYRSSGRFIYSRRAPQFSFGGRHLFARLVFNLQ